MAKLNRFHKSQILPISLDQAWDFFSNPNNLPEITPPDLGFKVLSHPKDHLGEMAEEMYPGMILSYSVTPFLGFKSLWVTEITQVQNKAYFIDEQRIGPYKLWHHEHHFIAESNGFVRVEDLIHFILPFGWLGDFFAGAFVRGQVEKIFKYRSLVLDKKLSTKSI